MTTIIGKRHPPPLRHMIPHIGAIPLQKLSPVYLNQLYRLLLSVVWR